jgi:hypothetical protein
VALPLLFWQVTAHTATATSVRCKLVRLSCFVKLSNYLHILYAVTVVHNDDDAFKKLQNVMFFNLCCFACDANAIKLRSENCVQKYGLMMDDRRRLR